MRLYILVVLVATLVATPAQGQGFPDFAPGSETVIVGQGRGPSGATAPKSLAVRATGEWRWDEVGLALHKPSPEAENYWFAATPKAQFTDGVVRARLTFGSRPDATILFRAQVPEQIERLSGYGLSVEVNNLRFYRWDDGLPTPQGAATAVPGLRQRIGIEIVIFAVGPLITATIYDVYNLEQIATLAITDRRYGSGVVGYRAYRRQDPNTRLTLLSVARAARAHTGNPDAMVGAKRVAHIKTTDLSRLPADLNGLVVQDGSEALMVLHLDELARVRRAGIVPVRLNSEIPFKFVNQEYYVRRGLPPEKSADGFVLDESYKDAAMVEQLIAGFAAQFPDLAQREQLGTSAGRRAIWALKISDHAAQREAEPAVLFDGGHHGLELLSTEVVLDTIATLLTGYGHDPDITRFVDHFEIWCVPLVNPDGNHAFMERTMLAGRKNRRDTNGDGRVDPREGVDLNRNYPFAWGSLGEVGSRSWPAHHRYRGPAPASEPETVAMMALARRERPVAAITYHSSGTVILSPYATDGVENPINDEAWPIAEEIANATPRQPSRRRYRVRRQLYPVDGVSKDWLRWELGTLAYLVELPLHNPQELELKKAAIVASRPIWQHLLARFLAGPSLSGKISDRGGAPVEAEIRIAEIVPRAQERWTSRPRDGRWARFLPSPGVYHLKISAPGFQPVRRRVRVTGYVKRVNFSLRPVKAEPHTAH